MWRDIILPGFPAEDILSLGEGDTDLFQVPLELGALLGLKNCFLKLEGQLPSGSFKDRGMTVAVSEVLRLIRIYPKLGIKFISCASTGDTSASAAAYAAYVRDILGCIVLIPSGENDVSTVQRAQVEAYGAIVITLRAKFDRAMELVREFNNRHPEIVLVNSINAMRLAGQEVISLEIFRSLNWRVPKWLVMPIGNGGNAVAQLSIWLRLYDLGLIQELPCIILAQTKAANTIVQWINSKFTLYEPSDIEIDTVASAMNIRKSVSFKRLEYLIKKGGFEVYGYDVDEQTIIRIQDLVNSYGAGVCPQSAVAINAAMQAQQAGIISPEDLVVIIATSNCAKFPRVTGKQIVVDPNINAVEVAVAGLN